nr:RecName: Full=Unknown protein 5 [Pinus halepensis]
LRCTFGRTVK